jgi:hypothetical protein
MLARPLIRTPLLAERNLKNLLHHLVDVTNVSSCSFSNCANVTSYSFSDVNSSPVELDNSDGTWLLTLADLADAEGGLHIYTPPGPNRTLLRLTREVSTSRTSFNFVQKAGCGITMLSIFD